MARNGDPNRPDLYTGYFLDFAGGEQRLAWALDQSRIFDKLCEIVTLLEDGDFGGGGGVPKPPYTLLFENETETTGNSSTSADTSSYNFGRFTLDVLGLAAGETATVSFQGSTDDAVWTDYPESEFIFTIDGTYTITGKSILENYTRGTFKSTTSVGSPTVTFKLEGGQC